MTILEYKVDELIRETLTASSSLQAYVPIGSVYTKHISDVKDPSFPCITMHQYSGDYLPGSEDLSFDALELEITTDETSAPKKQLDEIYEIIQGLLGQPSGRVYNSTYNLIVKTRKKPVTLPYYDDKKNKTLYKKTIEYRIIIDKL